ERRPWKRFRRVLLVDRGAGGGTEGNQQTDHPDQGHHKRRDATAHIALTRQLIGGRVRVRHTLILSAFAAQGYHAGGRVIKAPSLRPARATERERIKQYRKI